MNDQRDILLQLHDWSLVRDRDGVPVTILDRIDLEIERGEWVAVLGANGSGKTSLLRFLAADESPLRVESGLVFQDPDESFVAGTVRDELALGFQEQACDQLLADYGLASVADLDPRVLSAGQKQRLNLAVAEAGQPAVLLCDEPTSLQDARQTIWLHERLIRWRQHGGGTVVVTTQDRDEAALADRLMILESGRVVADGPVADMLEHPAAECIIGPVKRPPRTGGNESTAVSNPVPAGNDSPRVVWQDVGFRFGDAYRGFTGVDLQIEPGRRIGISGPNGCGKSTLLAVAAGLLRPTNGTCRIGQYSLYQMADRDLDHGLALLAPQFPEYLFTRATVTEEIELDPALAEFSVAGLLDRIGLPGEIATRNPHSLSSGQRRRLALAMTVLSGRPLILLDEPTAALDRSGKELVLEMLDSVPAETILIIASHDVDFLNACGCCTYRLEPHGLCPLESGRAGD